MLKLLCTFTNKPKPRLVLWHPLGRFGFVPVQERSEVVNHAILSAVHQERGAHRAFEIDIEHDSDDSSSRPWIRCLAA